MKKSSGGVKRAKLGGKKTTKGQDASPKAKKSVMKPSMLSMRKKK